MDQRRLRLGDILDDYCPRERRVTNHAVVAMIEEDVKQTRCTTCDAEHVYKGGKAPRRKKADETTGRLYKEVLAGITDQEHVSASPSTPTMAAHDEHDDDIDATPQPSDDEEILEAAQEQTAEDVDDADGSGDAVTELPDEGPVHRPLIRAQLPRAEGVKLERQAPDFTIRQNAGRGGGNFRGGGGGDMRARGGGGGGRNGGGQNNNGHRFGRGGPHRGNNNGGGGGGPRFDRGPRKRSR